MRINPNHGSAVRRLLQAAAWFCCSGTVVAEPDPDARPVPRAVPVEDLLPKFGEDGAVLSRSGQFRITGGDPAARGTAANLAEEAKDEMLRLTEEKDEWKVPVIIKLVGEPGAPVPRRNTALDIWFNEKGYGVTVFVNLSRGLRKESFKRAVVAGLVYARGLRDSEKVDRDVPLSVPPWVVEGLVEATAWRLGQTDRRLYDALFQHGGLFKLDDLFAMGETEFETVDAATRAAFKVSSGALAMALLEQPEGRAGIRAFLEELPAYEGEMPALLRRHFPELNLSRSSLAKWWVLQLAAKGSAPLTEAMSVVQTERNLDEALRLRYRDVEGALQVVPLSDWAKLSDLEEEARRESVRLAQDDLLRLSYRCFPSYRPLLLEYQALLADFTNGKTRDLPGTLAALAETRQTMVAKSERARDFLDWFEITRARETSGAFDDYLNLKARLKSRSNPRQDGMSRYLDRLDPLFDLPEETRPGHFPRGGFSPF